jgi:hypothetical protein
MSALEIFATFPLFVQHSSYRRSEHACRVGQLDSAKEFLFLPFIFVGRRQRSCELRPDLDML